jgi:predicted Zn-dependent protease
MTVEDEKRLTKEALPEMRKDYPAAKNPQLQSYISNLGNKIVRANNLENNPYNYNFTVVDVNMVNAFALPAGTVYVTAPLIAMADSEAELAGVVGHEIGHIKARHTAERMEKAKREQPKQWLYGAGGGILGGVLGYGIGKLACPPQDNECLAKAAGLGAAAGVGGGLLIHKYAFMANSREDEMEADRIGFRTASNAGYHKDHVGRFYEKLLRMEQQSKKSNVPLLSSITDAMSTHPPSQERVNQMNELAKNQQPNKNAIVSTAGFDQIKSIVNGMYKNKS